MFQLKSASMDSSTSPVRYTPLTRAANEVSIETKLYPRRSKSSSNFLISCRCMAE